MAAASPPTKDAAAVVTARVKKCSRCASHHVALGLGTFDVAGRRAQRPLVTLDKTHGTAERELRAA